jgi:hypothetical protein
MSSGFSNTQRRRHSNNYVPVQAQNLCEDEDENHSHKYLGFSNIGTDALQEPLRTIPECFGMNVPNPQQSQWRILLPFPWNHMQVLPPDAQNQNKGDNLVTGQLESACQRKKITSLNKGQRDYATYGVLQLVRRPRDRTPQ